MVQREIGISIGSEELLTSLAYEGYPNDESCKDQQECKDGCSIWLARKVDAQKKDDQWDKDD